jgi:hypothetical protein
MQYKNSFNLITLKETQNVHTQQLLYINGGQAGGLRFKLFCDKSKTPRAKKRTAEKIAQVARLHS